MTYESWRISFQSSEQAARAAYAESERLREAIAAIQQQAAPPRVKVTRETLEKASAAYCVAALSDDPSNLSSNAMLAALQSLGIGVEVENG